MHILLIEDDPRGVELARGVLAALDQPVALASAPDIGRAMGYLLRRGEHAHRPTTDPVVVFLGPGPAGSDVAAMIGEIRRHRELALIPIAAFVSSRDGGQVEECYGRGANACMVKPAGLEEFAIEFLRAVRYWAEVNAPPGWRRPMG